MSDEIEQWYEVKIQELAAGTSLQHSECRLAA